MTPPAVQRHDPDVERDRRERIETLVAEHGPDWSAAASKSDSFARHELLDRANLIGDLVEQYILSHPACLNDPSWFALADRAATALRELYQKIGQDHD